MLVYRLGHPDYIEALNGEGAAMHGGRWNNQGERMMYTAQTSSLAILEVLGHISSIHFLIPYQLVEIEVAEDNIIDYHNLSPELPESWSSNPLGEQLTRSIGSRWLKNRDSAILKVPSVHNPIEQNFLLNPQHPQFEANIISKHWYLYQDRLVRR